MDNTKIDDELKELNNKILKAIYTEMKEKGAKALPTGLISKMTKNGLELFVSTAMKYESSGRPPGKQPPLDKIETWAKKNLVPKEAAFPIARKIGREGVKGKHYLDDLSYLDKIIEEFGDILSDNFSKNIIENINKT